MRVLTVVTGLAFGLLLAACGAPADETRTVPQAQPAEENSTELAKHVVYYNAQPTDQLTAEIARAYGIQRSKNRAMLNVSVIDKETSRAVAAEVDVKVTNLTGQLKTVSLRVVEEGGALYYIGELPVANAETLIFDLTITPEGSDETSTVRFKRQFFSN
jgi:hypothetical protein